MARSISRQLRATGPGAAARRRPRRRDRPGGVQVSGSGPDGRDPQLIGQALESLLARQGWTTEVNLHLLLGRWAALVGAVNAEHSRPEGYADGVVAVRADSTAWATSLRTMAPQLVARLNEQLGQGTVTRIEVKGPDAPSWKHGRRSIRGARGPRDTYG
nr:DciA family protein [Auraticoccus monumenti]